jgi:YidC/Oxa1 family membrane protein insertase
MNTKRFIIISLTVFTAICSLLVCQSGLFTGNEQGSSPITTLAGELREATPKNIADMEESFDFSFLKSDSITEQSRIMGSIDPDSGYMYEIKITNKGAAVHSVYFSGFDDRDPDNPMPLQILSPVEQSEGNYVYSLANSSFDLIEQKRRVGLDKLNWKFMDGSSKSKVALELILKDNSGKEAIRFVKTYRIDYDSYQIECDLQIENLSDQTLKTRFTLQGPVGIDREDARADMRKVVSTYTLPSGEIDSVNIDVNKLRNAKRKYLRPKSKAMQQEAVESLQLSIEQLAADFSWAAITNKYFAAIVHQEDTDNGKWQVGFGLSQYYDRYDPQIIEKKAGKEINVGFTLKTTDAQLAPAGSDGAKKDFAFQVFVGPKDRELFEKNELYDRLGYFHTIDFKACCCPTSVIRPLAFGIMAMMKGMYTAMGGFGNYGIVIMILVFLVRLVLHPITKKSQISMMAMQKMSANPKLEEIKRKYANNKQEQQKHIMQFYKDEGVSPAGGIMGVLPMFLQMPIWIALWTSINTSVDLRGAGFLPFWITDLSSPDALIRFNTITVPVLGWEIDSFNLLPLLMGGVMFMQQKLMPHSSAAASNPQAAQQQKMMMIMMPLMFPIMLYKGPSGVNLYIMSSMAAGVLEQMIIRKHIKEKEEAESQGLVAVTSKTGGRTKKKKPKPFYKN